MAAKIRCKDEVIVLTGRSKGMKGKVKKVLDAKKVIVEGAALAKKHTKPLPSAGIEGGIADKEMAIDISNVAIFNSENGKADRVGFRVDENGKKVRIYKSTGKVIQ